MRGCVTATTYIFASILFPSVFVNFISDINHFENQKLFSHLNEILTSCLCIIDDANFMFSKSKHSVSKIFCTTKIISDRANGMVDQLLIYSCTLVMKYSTVLLTKVHFCSNLKLMILHCN